MKGVYRLVEVRKPSGEVCRLGVLIDTPIVRLRDRLAKKVAQPVARYCVKYKREKREIKGHPVTSM